jgi:hypothetical protein
MNDEKNNSDIYVPVVDYDVSTGCSAAESSLRAMAGV